MRSVFYFISGADIRTSLHSTVVYVTVFALHADEQRAFLEMKAQPLPNSNVNNPDAQVDFVVSASRVMGPFTYAEFTKSSP